MGGRGGVRRRQDNSTISKRQHVCMRREWEGENQGRRGKEMRADENEKGEEEEGE